jgi:hypothetical protein
MQSSSPPICKQIPLIVSFRLTTQVAPDPDVGDGLAVGAGVGDGVGVGVAEGVAVGVAVGSGLSVGAALADGSLLGEGVSLSALPISDCTTGLIALITGPPPTTSSAARTATAMRRAQGRRGARGMTSPSLSSDGSPIGCCGAIVAASEPSAASLAARISHSAPTRQRPSRV